MTTAVLQENVNIFYVKHVKLYVCGKCLLQIYGSVPILRAVSGLTETSTAARFSMKQFFQHMAKWNLALW